MPADWKTDPALPETIRHGLTRFCTQLTAALGDQLLAVVLYGGLAKGEFTPGNSDVNVLVVLRSATPPLRRPPIRPALPRMGRRLPFAQPPPPPPAPPRQ